MKAAELRQSILQAAVQGKLVTQDIHDEPASELLRCIQEEKAQLIKKGEIKKEKPLPPIGEDEIPYDLPEGWVWCKLGDICTFINGDRSQNYPSGNDITQIGVPFINSKNIMNYQVNLDVSQLNFITKEKFNSLRSGFLQDKHILFVLRGSVGKFGVFLANQFFNTGFINAQIVIIRSLSAELVSFILSYLKCRIFSEAIYKSSSGSAVNQLSASNLSAIPFPLPPLCEQKRIIAKLAELMVLCDELETAEKELDKLEAHFTEYLPKSILQASVQGKLVNQDIHDEPASELLLRIQEEKKRLIQQGKTKKEKPLAPINEDEIPYDLPEGWIWCRLGEVCVVNPRNQLPDNTEVSFTPMTLISNDYFGGHAQEFRKWGDVKSGFTHYAENDVVVAKITPCFQNGKSCIMRSLKNGHGAGTTELHVLRCVEIIPEYMLIYAKTPAFLIDGERKMTGTAGQQRVPTEYLKKCLFPLPPLTEQQRIVNKVDELMALCNSLKLAYTLPVELSQPATIVPFLKPVAESKELAMVARGDGEHLSRQAMQVIDSLFAEED